MHRPEVDDEVKQQVERFTRNKFVVDESKVSFNDRMKALLDDYHKYRTGQHDDDPIV